MLALADLEALLRTRKLDRTLANARPTVERWTAPTGVPALDGHLGGGLPRGELSEIAGPRSVGRMSLAVAVLAAATARGELAALVDTLDMFDPDSAIAAGIDPPRLLWIRVGSASAMGSATVLAQAVDRALKSLNLVLQCGNFGVVAIDLSEVPVSALRRVPFTTWMRVHRVIEGSGTVCLLLTAAPLARSAGGVSLILRRDQEPDWRGTGARARMFAGIDAQVRIVRSRFAAHDDREVTIEMTAMGHG